MVDRPRASDPAAELFGELSERLGDSGWRPAVDVYETEKSIVVQLELAGVSRDEVRITVDGPLLRVRGERVSTRDEDVQRLHQVEIASGPFERVLRIRIPFDREGVRASLDDGYLRVILPKRLPVRRQIPVAGGGDPERDE